MHVFGLAGLVCAHEVGQTLDVVDAHHVDVVVEAERLDEREVDLERDVALVLLIGGEHAERHAVWVTVRGRGEEKRIRSPRSERCFPVKSGKCRVGGRDTYTFMTLADS